MKPPAWAYDSDTGELVFLYGPRAYLTVKIGDHYHRLCFYEDGTIRLSGSTALSPEVIRADD